MYDLDHDEQPVINEESDISILVDQGYLEAIPKDSPRQPVSNLRTDKVGNIWCEVHGPMDNEPRKIASAFQWADKLRRQKNDFPMVDEARESMRK
jgi:hypothetical protein